MATVNAKVYERLLDAVGVSARFESKMRDAMTLGIQAAIEADSLEEFDATLNYLEDVIRQRKQRVPLAVERIRVVVHQAADKNISLADEYGNPRQMLALEQALEQGEIGRARLKRASSKKKTKVTRKKKRRGRPRKE